MFERNSAIGHFCILYGQAAALEARRQQLSINYQSWDPITLITNVKATRGDVTAKLLIHCRKCVQSKNYSVEASIPMSKHFVILKLPCGCTTQLWMCSSSEGRGTFFIADKNFNLVVEDVEERKVVNERLDSTRELAAEFADAKKRMQPILEAGRGRKAHGN